MISRSYKHSRISVSIFSPTQLLCSVITPHRQCSAFCGIISLAPLYYTSMISSRGESHIREKVYKRWCAERLFHNISTELRSHFRSRVQPLLCSDYYIFQYKSSFYYTLVDLLYSAVINSEFLFDSCRARA